MTRWHLVLLLWIGSLYLCTRGLGRFNALRVGRALQQDHPPPHRSMRSSSLGNLFPAQSGTWTSFEEYSASFHRTKKRNKEKRKKHRGKDQRKNTRLQSPSPSPPVATTPAPSPPEPAIPAPSPPVPAVPAPSPSAPTISPPRTPPTAPPPQDPPTPPITSPPAAPASLPPRLPPPRPPSPSPNRAPAPSPPPALSDASTPLPLNTSSCGVCGASYTGGVGDTLSSLSKTCNVDLRLLQEANPGVDAAEGRTVSVPCRGTDPANCGPCGAFYFVQEGDDFDAIAAKCNLPTEALQEANQDLILGADGGPELYEKQYLSVPCGQPQLARSTRGCGDCGLFYIAKAGDIVDRAALTCRVSDDGLLAANPALSNASSKLQPGQRISVPCFGESSRQCGLCGASYTPVEFESLAAVSAKCRTPGLEAANPGAGSEVTPGSPSLIVPCGTSPSPDCSPCSPEVRINDSSLDAMAKLCQVPAELLLYANGILPVQAQAPLRLGQNLSVPCAKLPAAASACSICGSSFLVTDTLQIPALAVACGIDEEEVYAKNNLSKSAVVEANSVLQLPCEHPEVGCGPCGVGYFPVEDEGLEAVAVRCRVYPKLIREENPHIVDFSAPLFDKALTMPCKMNVLDAQLSVGPPRHAGDMVPLLLASGALALLHLLG